MKPPFDPNTPLYSGILSDEEYELVQPESCVYQSFKNGLLSGVKDGITFPNVLAALLHRKPDSFANTHGCGKLKPYMDKTENMSEVEKSEVLGNVFTAVSRVWGQKAIIHDTTESGEKKEKKKKDPKAPKGCKAG